MPDEPLTRSEGRELRDAIKELTSEFRSFRTESAATFVRQDTHQRDLALLTESNLNGQKLLTQTLTALQISMNEKIDGALDRVGKIENDSDWLKKLIYSVIVLAVLGLLGWSTTSGVWHK